MYDYRAGKKVEIRPFMRNAIEKTWLEQEEEKSRVKSRVQEVEEAVRELEVGSWDQVGAVEDLGGKK